MKSPVAGVVGLILLFVVIIVGYSSVFTVAQTEQVLVVRLGEPVRVVTEPGLNFKAPFIDTVISIDKRILDLENPSQEVIASDQKRLVVDAFARYRIKNALRFYQSIGSIQAANLQLTTLLNAALRRVLGEVTFINVVRDERDNLMMRIRDQLDREADQYGIQVVDVRIRRADLPEQNSQAVYQRMQTERQREAAEFRAQGGQKAQDRDHRGSQFGRRADARRRRRRAQPAVCRGVRPGSGLLRLLPLDVGLRDRASVQRHPLPAAARL
jgi:membrane protease subunit HflC